MKAGPRELSADLRRGQVRTAFPALGLERVEPRFIKNLAGMVLGGASCLGPSDEEQGFSNFHGHRSREHCVKVQTLKEV